MNKHQSSSQRSKHLIYSSEQGQRCADSFCLVPNIFEHGHWIHLLLWRNQQDGQPGESGEGKIKWENRMENRILSMQNAKHRETEKGAEWGQGTIECTGHSSVPAQLLGNVTMCNRGHRFPLSWKDTFFLYKIMYLKNTNHMRSEHRRKRL